MNLYPFKITGTWFHLSVHIIVWFIIHRYSVFHTFIWRGWVGGLSQMKLTSFEKNCHILRRSLSGLIYYLSTVHFISGVTHMETNFFCYMLMFTNRIIVVCKYTYDFIHIFTFVKHIFRLVYYLSTARSSPFYIRCYTYENNLLFCSKLMFTNRKIIVCKWICHIFKIDDRHTNIDRWSMTITYYMYLLTINSLYFKSILDNS
jgi:hypothetical protein